MTGSRAAVRVGLRKVAWLPAWIGVALVSATFAYAMNGALTGSWTMPSGRPTVSSAPPAAGQPAPDAVAGDDAREVGRPCVSMFGSYNWWLFNSGGHGPCRMELDRAPDSPPDR
jgi:hypothetical protein